VCSTAVVTAGPGQYSAAESAWWVITDQWVILAGPFARRAAADRAVDEVVECLLAGLVRERRSTAFITARVCAVRVAHGRRAWPHGHFEAPGP
jgi:hypothetical protein